MNKSQFELEKKRFFHQLLIQLPLVYYKGQYYCYDDLRDIHREDSIRFADPEE